MGKHVKFEGNFVADKRGSNLGAIGWDDEWKCHIFVPECNTYYSWDCLRDIQVELQQRDRARRNGRGD